ncbi:hypothetical protein [Niabella sp.]|uniref:hypothetical protein n=1 Tax=Niabella sp. TaxID=1962976 RepID=UPI0026199534|nr:hypothetical protein [Niabella sp.]
MKKISRISLFFLGLIMLFTACKPDVAGLGPVLNKTDLKFSVTPDPANPNNFILQSLTPNVTPYWVTPTGKSIRVTDTMNFPFPGTDTIYYSVESAGGMVTADPYVVTVSTIDAQTVSDPMWINLTGGLGKSKTWKLDVNAAGASKYFNGPVYFAGANYSWEWDASWFDWVMPAGDYGTMTFDLIGNANLKVNNTMAPALSGTGKFMLNVKNKTLSTFGTDVLHDQKNQGNQIPNWRGGLLVKSLTADQLQLVAVNKDGTWVIYNYISQNYYDTH